ncbi:NPCBM/NEW2 domain-containing protein [Dactylosporangium sp. NPDC050688]|uniref:acyltransferase family protein n=1 Tax=Dactylosporangium sp. NPDC050688 TaxID=3157217 RepID=UPI0033C8CA2C
MHPRSRAVPQPLAQAASPAPAKRRERYIDAWRAAAVVRVVVYHGTGLGWLTVLFPAMGLMFALAGSLTARSLDRSPSRVVRGRLRRLLPPLWAYGLVMLPLNLAYGWGPFLDERRERIDLLWWVLPIKWPPPGAAAWGWMTTAVLWYLVAYLWLVVLSPVTLRAFRAWPVPTLAVALLLPVTLHLELFTISGSFESVARDLSIYLGCWLIGYAHRDGLLHRIPAPVFTAIVAGCAGAGAAWLLWHGAPRGDFDLNHHPVANGWWSVAFVAVVLRCDQPMSWIRPGGRLDRWIALVNARAVTIYLWHFPMLGIAPLVYAAARDATWTARTVTTLIVVAGAAVATLAFGWVEDLAARRPPRLVPPAPVVPPGTGTAPATAKDPHGRRVLAGFMVSALALAVVTVWWAGNVTTQSEERQPTYEEIHYVTDLPYTAVRNGLGPVERDRTNGGAEPDDGEPIVLAGVAYERGLGVHTPSTVRLYPPACERFAVTIGVDPAHTDGAAEFSVLLDGDPVLVTDPVPAGETRELMLELGDTRHLDLVVEDRSGSVAAVWADARFICTE